MSTEILQLVDDFEQLVNAGVRVPMSARVVVDERKCLDLLDQMRVLVPEEIRQARRIAQDRERTLQEALEQAERVTQQVEERAERLLHERGYLRDAESAAAQRVADANHAAGERRAGADQYAADMLDRLERMIAADLREVEGGLDAIGVE